jgi:RHS repeat-associated protein
VATPYSSAGPAAAGAAGGPAGGAAAGPAARPRREDRREADRRGAGPGLGGPAISLPTGGGAIRGIGEKFTAHPVSGTGGMAVPIPISAGRSGFQPDLALAYDSGAGNGPFGLGWQLGPPSVTRRTDRGLPQYRDDTDTFLLSGEDDLVPVPGAVDQASVPGFAIARYRPRIEGGFTRIERWTRLSDGDQHWRTLSGENVLAVYGRDAGSRIADPAEPGRVYSWLLCETRDDRGNAVVYRYKAEDAAGVGLAAPHERGRGPAGSPARTANRYLKSIRYGNQVPLLDGAGRRPVDLDPAVAPGWLFEVVLDYGEHDPADPRPDGTGDWLCRHDPFSTYRAGFEVRTYRLCQRVLMFHHFPDEPDVGADCLVRAVELGYRDDPARGAPVATFLDSVTQRGFKRAPAGGYTSRALPPVRYEYSPATIATTVRELDPESRANLPAGVDDQLYQWVDLDGEGLAGVLTEQGGGLYYRPSLGEGRLGSVRPVAPAPALTDLAGGRQQLVDLAGDGRIELVQLGAEPAGFHHRTTGPDGWARFVPFAQLPAVDWASPDLLVLDLTGDGRADLLLAGDTVLTWHPSLADAGYGAAQQTGTPADEARGPRLLRSERGQSVFLADLSGDGLTDLVRVRNGETCYWPNLGYGRFGAMVTMDSAPWFDTPDLFDPARIRLADVDGSGLADVLYLGRDRVRLWFNQSGNGWAPALPLPDLPHLADTSSVAVTDLLGNGTACLVWSSPLPSEAGSPVRYLDLMGGTKPHLLVRTVNNLGGETTVRYAASTKFYLADRRAGRPWVTRLPFPVHVVEQVEHVDRVSRTRATASYRYHHGHFDGVERELNGFGMVEQVDSEAFVDYVLGVDAVEGDQDTTPELFQPPVTTRTWFHTGSPRSAALVDEWYQGGRHLPEPDLPPGLAAAELREAVRALRGLPLRQEVYSFDGTPDEPHPYGVVEHAYEVRLIQPRAAGRPGVFLTSQREAITLSYDRDPVDPRVAHQLNLTVGPYGNVLTAAAVVYGRTTPDPSLPAEVSQDQQRTHVTYGEQDYLPDQDQTTPVPAYRLRIPFEARGYELTGVARAGAWYTRDELLAGAAAGTAIGYHEVATGLTEQKRLLSRTQVRFRDNALALLPAGAWDTLGLPFESYQLAFSPEVVASGYGGAVSGADLAAAGYVHLDGGPDWWIPSGVDTFPAGPAARFYLPDGARDALGLSTSVTLDRYHLLAEQVVLDQAAWSRTGAVNDYRVLGPVLVTDPNQQRRAVRMDELGVVVSSALLGRVGAGEGDTLDDPTERFEYDSFRWLTHGTPAFARALTRERHGPANSRWQESYVYSNGSGGVAMVKSRVRPGKALQVAEGGGAAVEVDADPRWVGNGRTIANNKGSPVKQYQPYYSTTHEYEDEQELRELGATAIRFYDPVGRNTLTRFPNGTLSRVEFTAWRHRLFDPNDTVLESQWYADRGSPDPAVDPPPADPEARAAWQTASHAGTPGTVHLDSLGRAVYTVADYGGGTTAAVRTRSDLTGRHTEGHDQLQRQIASGFAAMHGAPIWSWSAEKGRRWVLQDVLGGERRIWDEHGREFRIGYDELHRPVGVFVRENGGPERCRQFIVPGDRHPDAVDLGLFGVTHLVFDQAGQVVVPEVDFKGNPTSAHRVLALDYLDGPDWSAVAAAPDYAGVLAAAAPSLATAEVFATTAQYDALNRPVQVTMPDSTVLVPTYREGGELGGLAAQLRGQGPPVDVLQDQEYDARGQRQSVRYGNGLVTRYFYDPATFRLERLLTAPVGADPETSGLQDLRYTYDPSGNPTRVAEPQLMAFFQNVAVAAESRFEYDALYQLVRASGRELAGTPNDTIRDHGEVPARPSLADAAAVRGYTEEYQYDLLGNLLMLKHRIPTQPGVGDGWTRHYRYRYQDSPADATNRLAATSLPGDPAAGPFSASYTHDSVGNLTSMPHLATLDWNPLDQLRRVDLGGGGEVHYVYSASGQRMRKVVDRNGTLQLDWIFLGAVTVFRRRNRVTGALQLERWTTRLADDTGPIAQVDTKTVDVNGIDPANPLGMPLIRYQLTNHLGSAVLETDAAGQVISYEEYHPYGTTAYRYGRPSADLSLKRYRFSGHELDEETGLYYCGARYYAPWLGRWASSDPGGFADGTNLFRYARNNPVTIVDPVGLAGERTDWASASVSSPHFTEFDNPTVADFRAHFPELDPRVTEKNAKIRFIPNPGQYNIELRTWEGEPGGTWVLYAEFPRPAPPKRKPPPKPPPPPAPPPPEPPAPEPEPPPTEAPPEAPAAAAPAEPAAPAAPTTKAPGVGGGGATQAAPAAERVIWHYPFKGIKGGFRGNILEWLYGVPWRDNKAKYDLETANEVKQIKSTEVTNPNKVGNTARAATRDAAEAIRRNPSGTMAGKAPKAVVITPTDAPADVGNAVRTATNPGGGRKIPAGAAPPEHVRGLPGRVGLGGRVLTGVGFGFSAWALWGDYQRGDWAMGIGDVLGVAGGGLEIYAIAVPGATVAGASALTVGLAVGGLGIAVASGVSGWRAYQAGDTAGAIAGGVGVGAGLAITAGAIGIAAGVACAPLVLAVGAIAAVGVGIYHVGKYFDWW